MKALITAAIIAIITSLALSGCAYMHKTGNATIVLKGDGAIEDDFRKAAIENGGVVTVSSPDYSKAEFSAKAVKVELQAIQPGVYKLDGSSNTTVSRLWEVENNIGKTTKNVADFLVTKGFTITENSRDPVISEADVSTAQSKSDSNIYGSLDKNSIALIQQKLAKLGYAPGVADGIPGTRTRTAISAYQRDKG